MDAVLREQVRITIAKIEIALGYDAVSQEFKIEPNVGRAIRILERFQDAIHLKHGAMDSDDDETPLELLGIPNAVCGYLRSAGVTSIEQLLKLSKKQLLEIPQIKGDRLEEIRRCLRKAKLKRI